MYKNEVRSSDKIQFTSEKIQTQPIKENHSQCEQFLAMELQGMNGLLLRRTCSTAQMLEPWDMHSTSSSASMIKFSSNNHPKAFFD